MATIIANRVPLRLAPNGTRFLIVAVTLRGCEEIDDSGMTAFRESQFFLTRLGSEVPEGFICMDAIRIVEENHFLALEFAVSFLSFSNICTVSRFSNSIQPPNTFAQPPITPSAASFRRFSPRWNTPARTCHRTSHFTFSSPRTAN